MTRRMARSGRSALLGGVATRAVAAILAAAAPGPLAAGPEGGRVTRGAASIAAEGRQTTIEQRSRRAVIEWEGFDIGADESVRFHQPDAGAVALNRVRAGRASEIAGRLQADGQVWIVNPSGIAIRDSARIDVGGLLAATVDIADDDFMAGRDRFTIPGEPGAAVVNEGTITFGEAGLVGLVGARAENRGVIEGRLGTVLVGGRETLAVDLAGDGLIAFEVDPAALAGSGPVRAVNSGAIRTEGGRVLISAEAASALVDASVSVSGVVSADAPRESARSGGAVDIAAGSGRATVTGAVSARGGAAGGAGGRIRTTGAELTIAPSARLDASGGGAGGRVEAIGGRSLGFHGVIDISGGAGPGGFAETSAPAISVSGLVDASSLAGASGLWLIDPIDVSIGNDPGDDFQASAIAASLAAGTSITVATPAGAGPGAGDITLNGGLSALTVGLDANDASPTLTLDAVGSIIFASASGGIAQTGGGGALDLVLDAGAEVRISMTGNPIDVSGAVRIASGTGVSIVSGSDLDFTDFVYAGPGPVSLEAPNVGLIGPGNLDGVDTLFLSRDGAIGVDAPGIATRVDAGALLEAGVSDLTIEAGAGALTVFGGVDALALPGAASLKLIASATLSLAADSGGIADSTGVLSLRAEAGGGIDFVSIPASPIAVAGDVALDAGGDVDLDALSAASLDVRSASGDIAAVAGALLIDGAATFISGDGGPPGDILLDGASDHVFAGALSLDGEDVFVSSPGAALTLGAVTTRETSNSTLVDARTADNLTLRAGGDLAESAGQAIVAAGDASFQAQNAGGDRFPIRFGTADLHSFGGRVDAVGGRIDLADSGPLLLGAVSGDAALAFTARGAITQTADGVTSTGAGGASIVAENAAGTNRFDIALTAASNVFPGPVDARGEDVALRSAVGIDLRAVSAAADATPDATLDALSLTNGALSVTATGGALRQVGGAIETDGRATFLAQNGGGTVFDIALTEAANVFGDRVDAAGGNVGLRDGGPMLLGRVSAAGALSVTAGGPVTQTSDGVESVGAATFRAENAAGTNRFDIGLTAEANAFSDRVEMRGEDLALTAARVTLREVSAAADASADPTLDGLSLTGGSLRVVSRGALVQATDAGVSVEGDALFVAETLAGDDRFDIALALSDSNVFGGRVDLRGEDLAIAASGALRLGAVSAATDGVESIAPATPSGGGLLATASGGALTDSAGLAVTATGDAVFLAGNGATRFDIVLDGPNRHAFGGRVALDGEDVALAVSGPLLLGDVRARGTANDSVADLLDGVTDDRDATLALEAGGAITQAAGTSVIVTPGVAGPAGADAVPLALVTAAEGATLFDVALGGSGNDFAALSVAGADVAVFDSSSLALSDTAASTALEATAAGDLAMSRVRVGGDTPIAASGLRATGRSIAGADVDAGDVSLTATDGDVSLDRFRVQGLEVALADATVATAPGAPDQVDAPLEIARGEALTGLALRRGAIGGAFDAPGVDALEIVGVSFATPPAAFSAGLRLALDRLRAGAVSAEAGEVRLGQLAVDALTATATEGDLAKLADADLDFDDAATQIARVAAAAPAAILGPRDGDAPAALAAESFDGLVEVAGRAALSAAGDVLLPAARDGAGAAVHNRFGADQGLSGDARALDASGRRIAIEAAGPLLLGRVVAEGADAALALRAGSDGLGGGITQIGGADRGVRAAGPAAFYTGAHAPGALDAGALDDVTLDDSAFTGAADNLFGGPVSFVARDATVVEDGALTVALSRIGGDLRLAAESLDLSDVVVDGETILRAGGDLAVARLALPGGAAGEPDGPGLDAVAGGDASIRDLVVAADAARVEAAGRIDMARFTVGALTLTAGSGLASGTGLAGVGLALAEGDATAPTALSATGFAGGATLSDLGFAGGLTVSVRGGDLAVDTTRVGLDVEGDGLADARSSTVADAVLAADGAVTLGALDVEHALSVAAGGAIATRTAAADSASHTVGAVGGPGRGAVTGVLLGPGGAASIGTLDLAGADPLDADAPLGVFETAPATAPSSMAERRFANLVRAGGPARFEAGGAGVVVVAEDADEGGLGNAFGALSLVATGPRSESAVEQAGPMLLAAAPGETLAVVVADGALALRAAAIAQSGPVSIAGGEALFTTATGTAAASGATARGAVALGDPRNRFERVSVVASEAAVAAAAAFDLVDSRVGGDAAFSAVGPGAAPVAIRDVASLGDLSVSMPGASTLRRLRVGDSATPADLVVSSGANGSVDLADIVVSRALRVSAGDDATLDRFEAASVAVEARNGRATLANGVAAMVTTPAGAAPDGVDIRDLRVGDATLRAAGDLTLGRTTAVRLDLAASAGDVALEGVRVADDLAVAAPKGVWRFSDVVVTGDAVFDGSRIAAGSVGGAVSRIEGDFRADAAAIAIEGLRVGGAATLAASGALRLGGFSVETLEAETGSAGGLTLERGEVRADAAPGGGPSTRLAAGGPIALADLALGAVRTLGAGGQSWRRVVARGDGGPGLDVDLRETAGTVLVEGLAVTGDLRIGGATPGSRAGGAVVVAGGEDASAARTLAGPPGFASAAISFAGAAAAPNVGVDAAPDVAGSPAQRRVFETLAAVAGGAAPARTGAAAAGFGLEAAVSSESLAVSGAAAIAARRDASIMGATFEGPVALDAGGSVALTEAAAGGALSVAAGSGATLDDVSARALTLRAASGDAALRRVETTGALTAEAAAGRVLASGATVGGDATLSGASGVADLDEAGRLSVAGALTAESASGAVALSAVRVGAAATIDAGGPVALTEAAAGGALSVAAGSGATLEDVSARALTLRAASGDAVLRRVETTGALTAEAATGRVLASGMTVGGDATLSGASGVADLDEAGRLSVAGALRVQSASGAVALSDLAVRGPTRVAAAAQVLLDGLSSAAGTARVFVLRGGAVVIGAEGDLDVTFAPDRMFGRVALGMVGAAGDLRILGPLTIGGGVEIAAAGPDLEAVMRRFLGPDAAARPGVGDLTIGGFRDVTFGLDAAGAATLIAEDIDIDAVSANDMLLVGVSGAVVAQRDEVSDAVREQAERFFGVALAGALDYRRSEPSAIDLVGAVGGVRRRSAALLPLGPRRDTYFVNACLVGDTGDCAGSPPRISRVGVSFETPELFTVDVADLADVYASFGNEELWALSPAFLLDLSEEALEE